MAKFYLTTAIDYSNGDPYLGHALEKIGADCVARYRRLAGDAVHFLMGMDEHSQSVIQAAAAAGVTPQAWVDRMASSFADYWRRLQCSNDDWIRTTEPRHARAVTALLERIRARHPDDLFEAEYAGLYCTGCEEFKTGAQIVDGHCIEHPTLTLIPTKERNHFFRLSGYRDAVLERIRSGVLAVEPEIRRNEVVRLLEAGLQDISISRQRQPWGIPFPGDPQQTVYVWFDALINYLSATGFPDAGFERLWPADLHVIGKGITRFHCVIWPAMLLAAELPPPRAVWAHGYVQWSGTKMSKTAGTAVTLAESIDRHGADALRYFLLREVGFDNDGDFTWERFDARYTSELADTVGNLVSRALTMIVNYRSGSVPRDPCSYDTPLEAGARGALAPWTRTACRRAPPSSSRSRAPRTATSRRRRPTNSRSNRRRRPSSTPCSRTWHAPSPGSRCWRSRSFQRPPKRCGPRWDPPPPRPWRGSGWATWRPWTRPGGGCKSHPSSSPSPGRPR